MNATPKRLVVIELDPNTGTARGAWFDQAVREPLAKALADTAAVLIEVDGPKLDQIDADFPQGKVAQSGKPALPMIKRAVYDRLAALTRPLPAAEAPPAPSSKPDPFANLKPGSFVLASDSKDDGWWEATVVRVEQNGATLRLKWRDFPEYDEFSKPLTRVAIPPANGLR